MNYRKYFEKARNKEQNRHKSFTSYVDTHYRHAHLLYQEDKAQTKYARSQYKRNLMELQKQYMDKLYKRRQDLIDLYTSEERQLMSEFEQMKKNEQIGLYDRQNAIIEEHKIETQINMHNLKKRADNIRVQNSNEVRTEKMNLETAITATYNKFTKEKNEQLQRDQIEKESRYYEMIYMDDYEQKCFDNTAKDLKRREQYQDYSFQLKDQITELKNQKTFKKDLNLNIYLELTALEEKQIELEKLIKEEKKQIQHSMLKKTIEDNKRKIELKKEQIQKNKEQEVEEMVELKRAISRDSEIAKESKLKKKYGMMSMMQKQLAEVAKKVTDKNELDTLAQVEADKKAIEYDQGIIHKDILRKNLVRQAVFGNQEILKEKAWNRTFDGRQIQQDLISVNKDYDNYQVATSNINLKQKHDRRHNMNDLKYMMQLEREEETSKFANTLTLEKKLLKDAEKYDSDVEDIAAAKREYLDKLRNKRPF